MRMNWNKILCTKTLKVKEKMPSTLSDYPIDPFEQDYREIVSSPTFRYLQDKTQVYQFQKGDFVRTRLTHSLEVSTIAKQLGTMLIYNKKWNTAQSIKSLEPDAARGLPTVLACAGLLHDMGNPPFGHEGECAISDWFSNRLEDDDFKFFGKSIKGVLGNAMCTDLCNFEGNAQVLRMLFNCQYPIDIQTPNVSFATISTLIKYPIPSTETDKQSLDTRVHKYGYFYSERKIAQRIREVTGVCFPDQPHARNPLTYLLEAADDIAYIISDIEDAVTKKTVSIHEFITFITNELEKYPEDGSELHELRILTTDGIFKNLKKRINKCKDDSEQYIAFYEWTAYLKNWLMYVTAKSFVENADSIMNGTYKDDLLKTSMHKYTVEILKKQMYVNVYPTLCEVHIAAHTITCNVLTRLVNAVIYYDTKRELSQLNSYYLELIPTWAKKAYEAQKTDDADENLYLRFRMVIDYLTSMTDSSLFDLYKKLNATELI